MAGSQSKVKGSKSASVKSLSLPVEAMRALEALEGKPNARSTCYPDWHDDVIIKFYGVKDIQDISEALGGRSRTSIKSRANSLRSNGYKIAMYANSGKVNVPGK